MKTTVILLALMFVSVSFLNAQGNQTKTKKTNNQKEVVVYDGFAEILVNTPQPNISESMYMRQMIETKMYPGNQLRSSNQENQFSSNGPRVCCVKPVKIEYYNPHKKNKPHMH